jgi:hypothetical protein
MLYWPQGALGCAQDEGFVMLDAVCKLIKLAISFFAMQQLNCLIELMRNDAFSALIFSIDVTGGLVDPTVFLLPLSLQF